MLLVAVAGCCWLFGAVVAVVAIAIATAIAAATATAAAVVSIAVAVLRHASTVPLLMSLMRFCCQGTMIQVIG